MEYAWTTKRKNIFLTYLIIIIFFSCSKKISLPSAQDVKKDNLTEIKVERIEKFKNYYLIYARDTKYNSGYKIISADNNANKNLKYSKIELGKIYNLELFWLSEPKQEDKIGNYLDFKRCITKFPFVEICTESGFELYECNKLIGLEILKE